MNSARFAPGMESIVPFGKGLWQYGHSISISFIIGFPLAEKIGRVLGGDERLHGGRTGERVAGAHFLGFFCASRAVGASSVGSRSGRCSWNQARTHRSRVLDRVRPSSVARVSRAAISSGSILRLINSLLLGDLSLGIPQLSLKLTPFNTEIS
jgi:hypothetical protein